MGHELIYNPKNDSIYLFKDTEVWQFTSGIGSWLNLNVSGGPYVDDMPAVLDGKNDSIYFRTPTDIWTFDMKLCSWTNESAPDPGGAWGTYAWDIDPAAGKIYLTAGYVYGKMAVWEFTISNRTWEQFAVDEPVDGTAEIRAVYYQKDRDLYIYGGYNDRTTLDTFYRFNVDSHKWTQLNASGSPGPRRLYSMIINQTYGKIYIFGGWQTWSSTYNSTLEYDIGSNCWTEIANKTHPSARMSCGNAYDEKRSIMYIYGGSQSYGQIAPNTNDVVGDFWRITLRPKNPPFACCSTKVYSVNEDEKLRLDLDQRFSDPDISFGDELTYIASGFDQNCSVRIYTISGATVAEIIPAKDYNGVLNVTLTAIDRTDLSANETITIFVTPVNDPPVILKPFPEISMNEDTSDSSLDVSPYFDDADFPYGDSLAFSFENNGSVAVSISPDGMVTLRPFENWSGIQNITIIATDIAGSQTNGTLEVAVLNMPDAPVVVAKIHTLAILVGEMLSVDISDRFWDADIQYGDILEFSIGDVPVGWEVKLDARTGMLHITPPKVFTGTVKLIFTVQDSGHLNASEQVELTVLPVILGAFPAVENMAMLENSSADFSVVGAQVDANNLVYTWFLDGKKIGAGANLTYYANYKSAGKHNMTAVLSDGLDTAFRTWNLTVTNVNRPPVNVSIVSPINGSKFRSGEDVFFSTNAMDPDGDNLTFTWKDTSGKIIGMGSSFGPLTLSKGRHLITLDVSDGNATVSATVSLSVSPPAGTKAPGFTGAAALLAAAVAIFLATHLRRR